MSALLRLLNDVRTAASVDWLTPGQREAYERVRARLVTFSPTLLLGPPGSGKTLIGWLLQRESNAAHAVDLASVQESGGSPSAVVIDNADLDGRTTRELLAQVHLRGWTTAALLARWLPPHGIPIVRLPPPTPEDIELCLGNLPVPHSGRTAESANIWLAIRSLLESGETAP